MDGRTSIAQTDLELIEHVAWSSIPAKRRQLLQALRANNKLSSGQVEARLGVSRPTALKYMRELAATGIADLSGPDVHTDAFSVELNAKWTWLRAPLNETGV